MINEILHDNLKNIGINPYIYNIGTQDNCQFTDILPDSDFSIAISSDTEYINIRDEKGHDKKIYICGQFKQENQDHTSILFHSDMNDNRFIDKIPNRFQLQDDYNKLLVKNNFINFKIQNDDKPLIIKELERLSGMKINIIPKKINLKSSKLKRFKLQIYFFFGIADYRGLLKYSDNLLLKKIDNLHTRQKNRLTYRKHLSLGLNGRNYITYDNCVIRFTDIQGNHHDYILNLEFCDIFASLGPMSYEKYSKIVGHKLTSKNLLTSGDKSNMIDFMAKNPDLFLSYSLGDCEIKTMFDKYKKLLQDICHSLDLSYKPPKLSIGGTVANLLMSFVEKKTNLSEKQILKLLNHSIEKIKIFKGTTAISLALMYAGLCRSNNGRVTLLDLCLLIDIDLDGAYNNILNSLNLKIFLSYNKPCIYDIPIDDPNQLRNLRNYPEIIDKGITLEKYLRDNQSNFVPFGYQIIVCSDSDNMDYLQDFFLSKYGFQIKSIDGNNTLVEKTGLSRVFTGDIHLGILCHTSLHLLLNDANEKFVRYMLKHLRVISAAYYHKDNEVTDISELAENTDKWLGIPICELASKIQQMRKKYKKGTPENTMYKLIANTLYGVLASPYFSTSNPITANNITDAIRTACYLVEKKENGIKSITDGCQIELNNIFDNRHNHQNSMTISNTVGLNYLKDRELNQRNLERKSLLDGDWQLTHTIDILDKDTDEIIYKNLSDSDLENIEILDNYEIIYNYGLHDKNTGNHYDKKAINDMIFNHVFSDYSYLPICYEKRISNDEIIDGLVGIDIKNIYVSGVFHSSANYDMMTKHGKRVIAYRSIKSKGYQLVIDLDLLHTVDMLPPSQIFFNSIRTNKKAIARGDIFLTNDILTPTFYNHQKSKFDALGIEIGCNLPKIGYIKEFSITNFLYRNYKEFKMIDREVSKLKKNYGQSYEMFFQNPDGTLNYDLMIEVLSNLISKGLDGRSIYSYLSKKRPIAESEKYHPNFFRLQELKEILLSKWLRKNQSIDDFECLLEYDDTDNDWSRNDNSEYLNTNLNENTIYIQSDNIDIDLGDW